MVSAVQHDEMILALDDLKNLVPLSLSGINTSGVMGTNVEEDNLLVSSLVKILKHAIEIETFGVVIKVTVRLLLKTNAAWDCVMNRPCRRGSKNFSTLDGVELGKELKAKSQ